MRDIPRYAIGPRATRSPSRFPTSRARTTIRSIHGPLNLMIPGSSNLVPWCCYSPSLSELMSTLSFNFLRPR